MSRKLLQYLVIFLTILLIVFLIGEVFSRVLIGKRLIVDVEENGLYYFKPNQKGWYSHKISIPKARINNIGARGPDVDLEILDETRQYVFIGDSFTFGWEIEDSETLPLQFKKVMGLSDDEIVNLGNGGFSVDHMIEMYRLNKEHFSEGDVVVMVVIEDDFYRTMNPEPKSTLKEIFWKIRSKSSFISWTWASYKYINGEPVGRKIEDRSKNYLEESGDKLLDFKNEIENRGLGFMMVFFEYESTDFSEDTQEFCEKNNMFCVTNVYTAFENVKKLHAPDGGHPSGEANLEVAKLIKKTITGKNQT
jgi:hypothetical protein